MRMRNILLAAVALGAMTATAPALAQDTAPQASEQREPTVGDIIVTARKRQESILQVPVVETVLSQDLIDRNQIASLTNVSSLTPGILLGEAPLEVGTQVSIRGIGTTSLDPGIDQSVSLNLDGLQLSQGMAYSVGMFDMAQIEVLKGSQALFFGKNSPAGVVSIRTADPGKEFETMGRIGYEVYSKQWRGEAVVSGPITDTFGARLAAMYTKQDGYFKNDAIADTALGAAQPHKRFGKSNTLYLRGTALFEPSSDFNARLKLNYTRDRIRDGAPFQLGFCPEGPVGYAGIPFFGVNEDCKGDRHLNVVNLNPVAFPGVFNDGQPFTHIKQKFGTLELNYNIRPELTLTSVTGYYKLDTSTMIGGTYAGQAPSAIVAQKVFARKDFTQELRLNSDFAGPLNFTLGGFYQDGKATNDIQILGNTFIGFPAVLSDGQHELNITSKSLFGQLRFKPVEKIEISGGVRWTDEKRTDDAATFIGGVLTPVALPKLRTKNWSPELTVSFLPSDDLTIFGSLKQGYKSGSFNLIQPVFPGADTSFGDERARGAELGLKSRLMDRQVYVNLAGYYYKYNGMQVGVNEAAVGGLPVIRTVNAGSAEVYGVDFDFSYRPQSVPDLEVRGAANWNHARFSSFEGAPCWGGQTIGEGCNQGPTVPVTDPAQIAAGYFTPDPVTGAPIRYSSQSLTGTRLTRAPDWQINLGFSYSLPLGNAMKLSFGGDGQYSSKFLTNLGRRPDFFQSGYAKINANIALKGEDNFWEIALIGNNLTDKYTTGNCTNLNYAGGQALPGSISGAPIKGAAGSDELHCTFDRGREVFIRLTLRP